MWGCNRTGKRSVSEFGSKIVSNKNESDGKIRDKTILPETQQEIAKLYIEFEINNNGALGGGPVVHFAVNVLSATALVCPTLGLRLPY
jgi:hypothetical protein